MCGCSRCESGGTGANFERQGRVEKLEQPGLARGTGRTPGKALGLHTQGQGLSQLAASRARAPQRGHPPTSETTSTATQMATPSVHALFSRSSGTAAPRMVEICCAEMHGDGVR